MLTLFGHFPISYKLSDMFSSNYFIIWSTVGGGGIILNLYNALWEKKTKYFKF
jgi:hypothetical protein